MLFREELWMFPTLSCSCWLLLFQKLELHRIKFVFLEVCSFHGLASFWMDKNLPIKTKTSDSPSKCAYTRCDWQKFIYEYAGIGLSGQNLSNQKLPNLPTVSPLVIFSWKDFNNFYWQKCGHPYVIVYIVEIRMNSLLVFFRDWS